ncbi:CBS domain-containing protein [Candidatus Woesearchaeota archaeon]|nr:CBS domain-containing protein [Candidatus Woesearchaeota archaeon]
MIKIGSMMTKDVITIQAGSGILEAARLIASKSVSSLVVIDGSKPIAIVSENDIIRGVVSKKSKVREIMSTEFNIVLPSTKFSEIIKTLKEKGIKRFPVVENEKLVGLVTETDVIEATRDFTRFHQIVQEIILAIFGLATAFFLFYFSPLRASIFG